jgi:hypothetical protein
MLEASLRRPEDFETHSRQLFAAMQRGGPVGERDTSVKMEVETCGLNMYPNDSEKEM